MATQLPLVQSTIVVVWLIFGNIILVVSSTSLATFGDNCDATTPCDPGALLVCNNTICSCQSAQQQIFDGSKKVCVTKLGLECGSGRDTNCVSNARCSTNTYRCNCREGYFENPEEGTCLPERSKGEPCTRPEECSDTMKLFCLFDESGKKGKCQTKRGHGVNCTSTKECGDTLLCIQGSCGCDSIEIYDNQKKKCTTPVGFPCDKSSAQMSCVQNAQCVTGPTGDQRNGRCACLGQYHTSGNRTCAVNRGHGESCSEEEPCYHGEPDKLQLTCREGQCVCSNSDTEYDPTAKKCRKLIGDWCSDNSDCIAAGRCKKTGGQKMGKCVCKEDSLSPDDTGKKCLGGIRTRCNSTRLCNSDKNLVCRQQTCQCPSADHDTYDSGTGKCLTLVGGPCEGVGSCIAMAECTKVTNSTRKVCRCSTGYIPVDRRCYLAHGQPCDEDLRLPTSVERCDKGGLLICLNGTCQCAEPESYDFDEKLGRCRGLVGAKCDSGAESCVDGAICEEFRSTPPDPSKTKKNEGICECDEGYWENKEGRCVGK